MSGIDAQIPLSGRPVQFDPIETIGRLQQLRSVGLRNQQEQQTIALNQQTLDDNRAMGDAIQNSTTVDPVTGAPRFDTDKAMATLAKSGNGRAYLKMRDAASKWDEQQYRTFVERGTATKTGLDTIARTFNGVNDQSSYDQALGSLRAALRTAPPEVQASLNQLPPVYDKRIVDRIMAGTQTVQQHADLAMKIAEDARKAPGETADAQAKVRANAASTLSSAAGDFRSYQNAYHALPDEVASQFPAPEQWTPQTADDVLQRGMTPNQRFNSGATIADRQAKQRVTAAPALYAAALRGPDAYRAAVTRFDPSGDLGFPSAEAWTNSPAFFRQIRTLGTTTAQAESADSAAAGRAETARHNRFTEGVTTDPFGMVGGAGGAGGTGGTGGAPTGPGPAPIAAPAGFAGSQPASAMAPIAAPTGFAGTKPASQMAPIVVPPGAVGASDTIAGQPGASAIPAPAAPPTAAGQPPPTAPTSAAGALPVSTGRDESVLARFPRPVANDVKALVDGRRQMTTREVATPYGRALLAAAEQYDPSFDVINYNARSKVRNDFTSGTSAKSINALNTVIGHLESLSDAGDRLNNSSVPIWNSITNLVSKATGNPQVDQFAATRKAVVDELTRVWRGSGGSESDIKSWSDAIDASQSPAQLHGVIRQIGELLASKMSALSDQYAKGMGVVSDGLTLLSPQAKATLQKLDERGGAPNPSTPHAPPPAGPPKDGDERMVNGVLAVWTTINGQSGWVKKP